MDHLLPVESLPQIDFEKTRNEEADEIARWVSIDQAECNFSDLFDITKTNEDQQSSSDNENESDNGSDENETNKASSKRKKTKKSKMVIVKTKI